MRIHRISLFNLTYTIDVPVLFLFFAVLLDVISTSLFVILNAGTEANVILKALISISIWFIPVYLFLTNAFFVPFLSGILRKTFSYTFGLVSLLFGLNNFSLVVFDYAFLVDMVGFELLVILFVLIGLAIFVYFVKKAKLSKKQIISACFRLIRFVFFIGLVQSLFVVITWPAFLDILK